MKTNPTNASISLSPWQLHKGGDIINLPEGEYSRDKKTGNQLPSIFKYATIPLKTSPEWELAPLKDGKVHYGSATSSRLKMPEDYNKFKKVDFTYFRAFLDLSTLKNKIESAIVTIGCVDDQARMVLFNSKYPDGQYIEANDAKRGGANFIADFTEHLAPDGINIFVIIQVDDNPGGNMLHGGISVKIDNKEIAPDSRWFEKHPPFCPTGNVMLSTQAEVNAFAEKYPHCEQINGNLIIETKFDTSDITDLSPLNNITTITRHLGIINTSLSNINGLVALKEIGGNLHIGNNIYLTNINGLNALESVGKRLLFINNDSVTTFDGFDTLQIIGEDLFIEHNDSLTTINGLNALQSVEKNCNIRYNASFGNISGLNNLESIGEELNINHNSSSSVNTEGLKSLKTVNGRTI